MKIASFLILFTLPLISNAQWAQLGTDIDGLEANEGSGTSVSLSASGTVMAQGALNNNTNGVGSGQVRVYDYNGTDWVPKGDFITGNNGGNNLGLSIDLSADGNVVAAGAPAFLTSPAIAGYAKILAWDGSNWVQRGTDLVGTTADDTFGNSISLSEDGTIVAVGAEAFVTIGYIRIFEWDGTTWNQLGNDINGMAASSGFSRSLSLSADGTIVAISAQNSDAVIDDAGHIIMYEWDGTSWTQKGDIIAGDAEDDFFGTGVSINANGTIVTAGAREANNASIGYAKVHEWDGTNWVQLGDTIRGDNGGDFFADQCAINAAGDTVIYGTVLGNYARILKFNGSDWIQFGDDLLGEEASDQFGSSVAINSNGSIAAAGAPGNDTGGTQSGHVRVFENKILSINDISGIKYTYYPNPTRDIVTINSTEIIEDITVYTILGQKIDFIEVRNQETQLDLSNQPSGSYFASIKSKNSTQTIKLVKL